MDFSKCTIIFVIFCMLTLTARSVIAKSQECPGGCTCLPSDGFVQCEGLTKFPTTLPNYVTDLKITNSFLDTIPSYALSQCTNLKSIFVWFSNITSVSSLAFRNLPKVRQLDFRRVFISEIAPLAFSDLHNLSSISVSSSAIDVIKTEAFKDIHDVSQLVFSSNSIELLKTKAFTNLSGITLFQFHDNRFDQMEKLTFQDFINMSSFDLHSNKLNRLACQSLSHLTDKQDAMVFFKNTLTCDCHLNWVINKPSLNKFLSYNFCVFSNGTKIRLSKLVLNDCQTPEEDCSLTNQPQVRPTSTRTVIQSISKSVTRATVKNITNFNPETTKVTTKTLIQTSTNHFTTVETSTESRQSSKLFTSSGTTASRDHSASTTVTYVTSPNKLSSTSNQGVQEKGEHGSSGSVSSTPFNTMPSTSIRNNEKKVGHGSSASVTWKPRLLLITAGLLAFTAM